MKQTKIEWLGNYQPTKKEDNPCAGRVYGVNGLAPTIRTKTGGGGEPAIIVRAKQSKQNYIWGGLQDHQTPRKDGLSPSLTAAMGMGGGQIPVMTEQTENAEYRIRKLTAKECWRLMNYSDKDYSAAEKVVSHSQLYKQAGNAIVENVLIAIFGQMIPGKENVYKERG